MEQISKKSILLFENIKIEHHYWVLHIRISLSTNFQLKFTIAIFRTKFSKNGSYFQSKTNKIDKSIEFWIFQLVFVSNFILKNFEFLDQICPRKIFIVKNRKSEYHHWISVIQTSLVTKFQLKLTILTFLTKKDFSSLKQKNCTQHIFYAILHIQISLVRNFSSNWHFWFFGPNLHKKLFPVEKRKCEHHHEIVHIWINLGAKFQLKRIILNFLT